ncbi:hypothetical protein [Propionispira raffinosivorans]|uniref:hypothetical protein n=1 Tax=Propionispira raffinosivorans TaxID=86959 RepID=UPI00037E533B|nr:hypothetical protein [Propionispira raffinosivorans]
MGKKYDFEQYRVSIENKKGNGLPPYQLSDYKGYLIIEMITPETGRDIAADGTNMITFNKDINIKIKVDNYADFEKWLNENNCGNYIIELESQETDKIKVDYVRYIGIGEWKFRAYYADIPPALYL